MKTLTPTTCLGDLPLRLPGECLFTKKHEVGSTRYNNAKTIENNLGSPTMILRLVPSLLGSGIVGFVVNGQVEGLWNEVIKPAYEECGDKKDGTRYDWYNRIADLLTRMPRRIIIKFAENKSNSWFMISSLQNDWVILFLFFSSAHDHTTLVCMAKDRAIVEITAHIKRNARSWLGFLSCFQSFLHYYTLSSRLHAS